MHGVEAGHMTVATAAWGGAAVALAGLHQREGDALAALLARGRGRALADGGGGRGRL